MWFKAYAESLYRSLVAFAFGYSMDVDKFSFFKDIFKMDVFVKVVFYEFKLFLVASSQMDLKYFWLFL